MRLEPITALNWRAVGALRVAPGQLGMVAEFEPVAFVILARTYVGYENGCGIRWLPSMTRWSECSHSSMRDRRGRCAAS